MTTVELTIRTPRQGRPFSILREKERVRVLPDDTIEAWVEYTGGFIASLDTPERYWSANHILGWTEERNLRAVAAAVRQTRKPEADGVIRVDCTGTTDRDPATGRSITAGLTGEEHAIAGRLGWRPIDFRGIPLTAIDYLDHGQRAPGAEVTCPMVGTRQHATYLESLAGGAP